MTADSTQDKQITIAVPEDRVAEFYAFYGRWLAGYGGRHGHRGRSGRRCHPGQQPAEQDSTQTTSTV